MAEHIYVDGYHFNSGEEADAYHLGRRGKPSRRERIATAVLSGLTASGDALVAEVSMEGTRAEKVTHNLRAFYAVRAADALIKELDKPRDGQ